MRRRILLALTLTLSILATTPTTSQATADCNQTWESISADANGVTTGWQADCNLKWQATIVLMYRDNAGVWHVATCQNGVPCRRDKPNDGSWFAAGTSHTSVDDWNPTVPGDICSHAFRLRGNYRFYNGAGGITWNGSIDNDPCHI